MAKAKIADVVPSRFVHLTPANEENIERIRADLEHGSKMLLNDPHAFREDGKWELLAGHDRVEAARRAGWTEIQVRDFSGAVNSDDAILAHFCRENLLRKEISKAAIAGEWLRKHPEWSDGKIADESGCTAPHVGTVRAELGIANPKVLSGSREGRDGKVREVKPRASGLRKDRPTPDKPKSEPESAAEMMAKLSARTQPVPPKAPSVVTGELEERSETPESEPGAEQEGREYGMDPDGIYVCRDCTDSEPTPTDSTPE